MSNKEFFKPERQFPLPVRRPEVHDGDELVDPPPPPKGFRLLYLYAKFVHDYNAKVL